MRLEIVQVGDPVLRHQARPLSPEEIRAPEVQQLIELMRETMHNAPGVGLAAPQIGLALQLAVIQDTADLPATERTPVAFHVIANPHLTLGDERVEFYEGCLSVEGFQAVVPRARSVRVEALDHRGEPVVIEASGWYARILQHEIDHLNGKLYIDRMRGDTLATSKNFARYLAGVPIADVIAASDVWRRDLGPTVAAKK
jgi:peptide deformylase